MDEFKYFKINVCENKLEMTSFLRKDMVRDDFIEEFTTYLFMNWFDQRCSIVYVLIREMYKNVFDHGIREATLILNRVGNDYTFEFIDHNSKIVSFTECCEIEKDKDWVQKCESNCNAGMWYIQSLGKEKGVILNVDDTKGGINYSGSYTS